MIKTHDLTNEQALRCFDELSNAAALRLLRPVGALRLFIPLRCMNAQGPAVEPGTGFDASMNSATSAASSASSAVKKALRLLRAQGPRPLNPGPPSAAASDAHDNFLSVCPLSPIFTH